MYREQNALDDFIAGDAYVLPMLVILFTRSFSDHSSCSIFMRNWPFCIKSIKDAWVNNTRWEFDFSGPPGRHANQTASTLGGKYLLRRKHSIKNSMAYCGTICIGWHLAISKQTKDAAAAAKVLEWLTSAEIQKVRATAHGVLPSIPSLYQGFVPR